MSAHGEQPNETSESHTPAERIDEASTDFSPKLMEERIKANLEPLPCPGFNADAK